MAIQVSNRANITSLTTSSGTTTSSGYTAVKLTFQDLLAIGSKNCSAQLLICSYKTQ